MSRTFNRLPDRASRVAQQRLLAAQVSASIALPAGATAGGLLAVDIAGPAAAALPLALLVTGSGFAAVAAGGMMPRVGRRAGLRGAYLVAALGTVLIVTAGGLVDLSLLLAGSALFGAGNAAAMLSRYAAADLVSSGRRGYAVSRMLLALTVGAVTVPNLLGPAAALARPLGLPPATGLFLLAAVTFVAAAVLLPTIETASVERPRVARWAALRVPSSAVAPLAVLAVSNLAMVTVMAVVPPLLHAHGAPLTHVGLMVSAHVAAMYAPAPLAGRAVDRYGPRIVAAVGTLLMVLTGLLGLSDALTTDPLYAGAVLLLVGLAWSTQVVAGSTWLTQSTLEGTRAGTEGLGEAGMSIAAAAGGLAAAPLLAAGGIHALMATVLGITACLALTTVPRRAPTP